ncbi:ribose 5-phosphate isomerase A [Candidatus Bathyarchaeota archaeon]|nr:ribose 5-phosphate isomerase A [Candidatus Bathyarchaeota archaeon]
MPPQDDVVKARLKALEEVLKIVEYEKPKIIGLGSGSTISLLIDRIANLGLNNLSFVCSSIGSSLRLSSYGFKVLSLESVDQVDLYVDSADEVDPNLDMVKGGGGCLTLEKILAYNSSMRIFVVDYGKLVDRLCLRRPIPLDVIPQAISMVCRKLRSVGFRPEVRLTDRGKFGPLISDIGGVLVDLYIDGGVDNPGKLDMMLKSIPGIVETGLFIGYADLLVVGYPDKVIFKRGKT